MASYVKNVCLQRYLQRGFTNLEKNNWISFYFLCLRTTRIGFFIFSAFFLKIPFMRVKLCRYLSSYDPIRKQETQKLFFINKYQSCRRLNTSLLLRSFPSLCKTTMGSHTWDFLIARSPKAPSKIYSPLSPKEDLILSQATNAFYMLW